jgi:hypothetical protein
MYMGLRFRTQEIYYVKSTTISEKEGDHFLILGATNIIVVFFFKKKMCTLLDVPVQNESVTIT